MGLDIHPSPFLAAPSPSPPQCRAMGLEIPPLDPDDGFDMTLPDTEAIEKQHDTIQAYMDAVYGPGANIDGEGGGNPAGHVGQRACALQPRRLLTAGFAGDKRRLLVRPQFVMWLVLPIGAITLIPFPPTTPGAKGTKRAAPGAQRAAAAADSGEAYVRFDWTELAGRAGALEKLTIDDLK